MKSIKVSTEIIFHKNKQILVVKSWQKILYQDKPQEILLKIKRNKSSNNLVGAPKVKNEDDDNSQLLELPPGFDIDKCFFIKTLQFFTELGHPYSDPILVEMVPK
jgi:hypothetical protein